MAVLQQRMTYDMLQALPEERRELLDGELFVAASPAKKHQLVVKRLERYFDRAEIAGYGQFWPAPFDVYLDQYNVTQPDVIFVGPQHLEAVHEDKMMGVPDLLVEILSPSTAHIDRGRSRKGKLGIYERFGLPSYWIIDPAHEVISVYTLLDGRFPAAPLIYRPGDVLTHPLFPEMPIPVSELFQ
jgi:Uma2 family endonuclease